MKLNESSSITKNRFVFCVADRHSRLREAISCMISYHPRKIAINYVTLRVLTLTTIQSLRISQLGVTVRVLTLSIIPALYELFSDGGYFSAVTYCPTHPWFQMYILITNMSIKICVLICKVKYLKFIVLIYCCLFELEFNIISPAHSVSKA